MHNFAGGAGAEQHDHGDHAVAEHHQHQGADEFGHQFAHQVVLHERQLLSLSGWRIALTAPTIFRT